MFLLCFHDNLCLILVSVNHKTEDEVLQSLHRQAQRKVLRDLQGTMHKSHQTMGTGVTDDPLLERYMIVHTSY